MQPAIALTNPQPFVMDDLMYINIERKPVREKLQREFKLLAQLRMAVLLSVLKHTDDELLDDPRIETRLNALLDEVRYYAASHNFHDRFTRRASELVPGIWMKINHSCTEASIYRDHGNNVVFMEVSRG